MEKIYENIKHYRKRMNLTQEELAKRVGYSDKTMISKIEKGIIDLPISKVETFATVFGVRPGVLMGWFEETAEESKMADNAAFIDKYQQLDSRGKSTVQYIMDNEHDRVMETQTSNGKQEDSK